MAVAPSRGRGSKQRRQHETRCVISSPPHGGVDRNVSSHRVTENDNKSPPHGGVDRNMTTGPFQRLRRVAPSRGRGSKPFLSYTRSITACRPLTGAWIETRRALEALSGRESPPHGGVDRNWAQAQQAQNVATSPPHGGVDRNADLNPRLMATLRRPLTGAWIETEQTKRGPWAKTRRPLTGAWIETSSSCASCAARSSPPHGGVDRNRLFASVWRFVRRRPLTGAWIETVIACEHA